ncbi:MAG: epoxyqueuosine reductase QueH [Candidatus Omnitrophota bacterium]|nr:epoxyqueuosine reductase QueH [Candidatus Omnitrophota bacterium]
MQKVLLHICCGICACGSVSRLRQEGFEVIGYFYNPNIHPEEEYKKRLEAAKQTAENMCFELRFGSYDKDEWLSLTAGFEDEPESGLRCQLCYRLRLQQANNKSTELGCDYFTTTLSVSPHKDSRVINNTGLEIGAERFLPLDFKKKGGFQKANTLAKDYSLYRQNYCGCIYSRNIKLK